MPKETRDIKQYKTYTLVHIKRDETAQPVMLRHVPVAVFDDKDLAIAYVAGEGWKHNDTFEDMEDQSVECYMRPEWSAIELTAEHTSLPFNPEPKPKAPVEPKPRKHRNP